MINTKPSCTDIDEAGLISVNEALSLIFADVQHASGYERIAIETASKRILTETITAPFNVPAHTNSAVDGYGICCAGLSQIKLSQHGTTALEVIGEAYAGEPFTGTLKSGQCVRIMTGAIIPDQVDAVVMQEHTERHDDTILIDARHKPGQNIRKAGEDIRLGETILHPGRVLTPADIGLMASLGIAEVNVNRKLKVAIISTGNEIHSIGQPLTPGTLYDSNRYLLLTTLDRPDIEAVNLGIHKDNLEDLTKTFQEASEYADVIISTGGVSVGAADYTKTALQTSGAIRFWKIAIKPGRPLAFGKINNCVFFGLPGNPVAVMVTFCQFVLPALEKMLGIKDKPIAPIFLAQSTEDLRKKPGRTEIQRGIIEQNANGIWTVKTTGKQGSGILRSMSLANAFIILDHDQTAVKTGGWVKVQPFSGLM
ncbi:gephyrin-like molybdotransferase Glp [Methyloglobulus sp.]|uniref:molybdopterin molybdotransferase MoeA n=1 Tax=Methyloglobulus sp. TaxID=2518622 RepID=UPI003988DF4E